MDILVVTLLVEAHRSALMKDLLGSKQFVLNYGAYFIPLFPLITVFAFVDNAFESESKSTDPWCRVNFYNSMWSIAVYSFWVWLFLTISVISTVYSGCRIGQSDRLLARKYFSSVGLYAFIALGSWLPRAIQRISLYLHPTEYDNHFLSSYPYLLSGICYAIIFFRERRWISLFSEEEADSRTTFSWEVSCLSEMAQNNRRTGYSSSRAWSSSNNPFLNFYPRPSSIELSDSHRISNA
jgi:hypothetical protein